MLLFEAGIFEGVLSPSAFWLVALAFGFSESLSSAP